MALIVIVVGAIVFQAYMTHVIADLKASVTFDRYAQLQGERRAIANLVRESVLEYYERPRLGQDLDPADTVVTILNGYLTSMHGASGASFVASISGTGFPSPSKTSFWPMLDPDNIDANVDITGGSLVPESLPASLARSRIARYFGPGEKAISVQTGGSSSSDVFQIDVTRTSGGTSLAYHFFVRMFGARNGPEPHRLRHLRQAG
jgi:hypothetical protein